MTTVLVDWGTDSGGGRRTERLLVREYLLHPEVTLDRFHCREYRVSRSLPQVLDHLFHLGKTPGIRDRGGPIFSDGGLKRYDQ